ncbi:hypothetical protein KCU67_g10732, partial [Aureobasidium melanogenum]
MKRESEALETSREPSIEPEDLDAKYQAVGKKYLETKERLDLATKNNPGMVEEHKRWPGDVPFARSEQRKIECEAWEAQATREEEAMYWRTLALAAYCFLEGMVWAGSELVSGANRIMDRCYEIAHDSDGEFDRV